MSSFNFYTFVCFVVPAFRVWLNDLYPWEAQANWRPQADRLCKPPDSSFQRCDCPIVHGSWLKRIQQNFKNLHPWSNAPRSGAGNGTWTAQNFASLLHRLSIYHMRKYTRFKGLERFWKHFWDKSCMRNLWLRRKWQAKSLHQHGESRLGQVAEVEEPTSSDWDSWKHRSPRPFGLKILKDT
jgi:hypothetical protein